MHYGTDIPFQNLDSVRKTNGRGLLYSIQLLVKAFTASCISHRSLLPSKYESQVLFNFFFLQFWFNYNVSSHWQIYPNTLKEYYESQVKVLADDRVYLQRRLAWTVTQNQIFFVRKTNPEQNGPCQRIVFLFSLKRLWEFCS